MNCRKVSHLLSAYMDGELPGVEHQFIHQHLSQCRECHSEYLGLLQVKRLLAGMRVQEPRAALPGMILHRLADEQSRLNGNPFADWLRQFHQWWRQIAPPPPIIAFGAGLAAVGILWTLRMTDSTETMPWNPTGLATTPIQSIAAVPGSQLLQTFHGGLSESRLPGLADSDFNQVGLNSSSVTLFPDGRQTPRRQSGPSEFIAPISPGQP